MECYRVCKYLDDIESSYKLNRKWNKLIIVKFVSYKIIIRLNKVRVNLCNIKLFSLFLGNYFFNF